MCKIWVKWTMSIVDRVIYFTGDGENNFSWKCNFFWWQKVKRISFLLVSISEIYYTKDQRGIISSQNLLIQFLVLSFDTFLYMNFVLVPWWNMELALVRIWWFVDCWCQIHACFQQDLLQNRFKKKNVGLKSGDCNTHLHMWPSTWILVRWITWRNIFIAISW